MVSSGTAIHVMIGDKLQVLEAEVCSWLLFLYLFFIIEFIHYWHWQESAHQGFSGQKNENKQTHIKSLEFAHQV